MATRSVCRLRDLLEHPLTTQELEYVSEERVSSYCIGTWSHGVQICGQ